MNRFNLLRPAFIAAALIGLAGCSSNETQPKEKPTFTAEQREKETAQVVAIDAPSRVITLRADSGDTDTFLVDRKVRNLEQVKVGDRVAVDYHESLSIKVLPPGEPVNEYSATAERAEPGAKPGGTASQHLTMTATVVSVDKKASLVTVRGPAGNLRTIKARDAKKLDQVEVGDHLRITYTESLAVSVTPASPQEASTPQTPAP